MMMWLDMDRRFLGELLLTIARKGAERQASETRSSGAGASFSCKLKDNHARDDIPTASKTRWIKL